MKQQQASLASVAQNHSILDLVDLNYVRAGQTGDPDADPYQYDPNLSWEENEINRRSRRTRAMYIE